MSCETEKMNPWEEIRLRESAIDTISCMLGFNLRDIMEEEAKKKPNAKKLKSLEKDRDRLFAERELIYQGNYEAMKKCVESYSPTLRERYSK